MAIAYARFTIYARSQGHSAVGVVAYRSAEKLKDDRTRETHDYRKRTGHLYSAIYLPKTAHRKYLDRGYFWNQVEKAEMRKNAQLLKELFLALPKELDFQQHIALVKAFSHQYFISNDVPVDISIYDHGDSNPFAYVLATTRRLFNDAFHTHKARDLDPPFRRGYITEKEFWGKRWGDFQTHFFERHAILVTVDKTGFIPQVHEGQFRNKEAHYLKAENKLRKALSAAIEKKAVAQESD
jgi:hypothetical protein